MRVYLSSRFGADISGISKMLDDLGIQRVSQGSDLKPVMSFLDIIKSAVKDSDAIIVIYEKPGTLLGYEIGLAQAFDKPVFSIITAQKTDVPEVLKESVYVFAKIADIETIKYSFNIFLKNIKSKKKQNSQSKKVDISTLKYDWTIKYKNIDKKNERNLEILFNEIFEFNKLDVIANKQKSNIKYFADFCIWSDYLSSFLGNPILIEIKKSLDNKTYKKFYSNFQKTIDNSNANSGIVFYENLNDLSENQLNTFVYNKILSININTFLDKLKDCDFNQAIIETRNELIHKKL